MAIDPFRPRSDIVEAEAENRSAIVRYLLAYLRTGESPSPPWLRAVRAQIRSDTGRKPLGQCAWKWSEITGKYVGCQFWSIAAARELELLLANEHESLLARRARRFAWDRGPLEIEHEHVFPRKAWQALMEPHVCGENCPNEVELRELLNRYCVGCVVTCAEHAELGARPSDRVNPWVRYHGTSIRLVENPNWSDVHRRWIAEAGLA